ncbi:MAG: metallophosphoesterase [Anaerolineales bacterium]|nr:metallophosphoesterase [Anaerolineales bacterium]
MLISFLPLLLLALPALYSLRVQAADRRRWLWITVPALACGLADALLLYLLPLLRLSFGSPHIPLLLFNLTRLGFVLVGILLLPGFSRRVRSPAVALPGISTVIQVSLLVLAFYGLYVEPFRLGVTHLQVTSPALLPDRPLRILQISDLHVERISPREREVLVQAEALRPDLIVLTGDYVNLDYIDDPVAWADARAVLAQLRAPYGVYAVLGTVDRPQVVTAIFDGLEIRLLTDKVEVLALPGGDLILVGISTGPGDDQVLYDLTAENPPGNYTLLLYHTPDLIEPAVRRGVDLYLAGHTHGGQIRLPFYGALVTFSEYGKQYEMGEYHLGATTLYVSRGLGMEGWGMPRMRFLCPPELVLVELGE